MKKLADFSGLNTDNKIIGDLVEELKILLEVESKTVEYSENKTDYIILRNDEIQPSDERHDILSNSKSKTQTGFYVNKII